MENVPEDLVKLPVTVITCVVPELRRLYAPVPVKLKLFTVSESKAVVLALTFPDEGIEKVPPMVTVSAALQPKFNVPVLTVKLPEIFTLLLLLILGSITEPPEPILILRLVAFRVVEASEKEAGLNEPDVIFEQLKFRAFIDAGNC